MEIYTLGHSTRTINQLLDILEKYNVKMVIDVRNHPKSSRNPQFNMETLKEKLLERGVEYQHIPELGGYKPEGYMEYMKTNQYRNGIAKMLNIINSLNHGNTLILCSEKQWYRCHRKYIANQLAQQGYKVTHIYDINQTEEHEAGLKSIEEKMRLVVWCDKKARRQQRRGKQ